VPPSRWGQFPSASLVGEIESGRIRALVVVGGNPLSACPGSGAAAEALSGLPLLAVADVVEGPLTAMATHTMPCASQLERADLNLTTELAQPLVVGQYTPALRRRGPGVRSAWWWLAAVAHHLGRPLLPDGLDLDAGDDAVLDLVGGARAAECRARPVEHRDAAPLRRPWVHDALPGGRWQLAPAELLQEWRGRTAAVAGPGLVLVPHRERGRINSAVVAGDAPACLALHPVDAGPAHIEDGDWVEVTSSSGRLTTRARLDPRLRPGAVMVPHGHTGVPVNELTTAASMNPRTGMPVYAAVAVTVRRTTAPRG
jgi:anaerobic selenocysteine-containing dehydrogenase